MKKRGMTDAEYCRSYYRKNIAKWQQYKVDWNTANPERLLLASAKSRAKKNGTEINITAADIIIPQICPVLGLPIEISWKAGGHHDPRWNSPSLDRIDPSKGYIRGNVRVISWRANSLKRDGTLQEMRLVLADLERLEEGSLT